MTIKVQYNPSTGKVLYNPVTKKVMTLKTCDCVHQSIEIKFEGVNECEEAYWPSELNVNWTLDFDHEGEDLCYYHYGDVEEPPPTGWYITLVCSKSNGEIYAAAQYNPGGRWQCAFVVDYPSKPLPASNEITSVEQCGTEHPTGYGIIKGWGGTVDII